ncbi:hypothetical protein HPB47_020240 [Ixodes persulcatus]|uniref:Uncharacterized protein n=1 Tax=Ixodes persulcatus TaxID=34615 RepID=A0AC60QJF2_IXOPE|nr:hypothetical protein HPB47_020240 [Ixodes persulcatus]
MASFVPDYSPISMTNPESMRMQVAQMLKGIDRYNPENLIKLENYVQIQATENMYDLEANLAVLKLYQFNPSNFKHDVVATILLKALTNLPHTDFVLCKCLIDQDRLSDPNITLALKLHYLLEMCEFQQFWQAITKQAFLQTIKGFKDSIRKFVCYVVSMTYQNIDKVLLCNFLDIYSPDLQKWIAQYNWKDLGNGSVFIANQEEIVKTKNITEKIDFENVVFTEESSSGRPPGAEGVASSQNLIWKQLKSYDSIMRQCLKSHLSIRLPGAPCNRSHIALKRKWSLHERVLWCRNER